MLMIKFFKEMFDVVRQEIARDDVWRLIILLVVIYGGSALLISQLWSKKC
jgi:hypothetical protein